MFQASIDPVGGSLALSALVGCIPLVSFFVCLVGIKMKAHWSALVSLIVALIVAVIGFQMPANLAFFSALQGAAYGIFPICFILLTAVWFYNITVKAGRAEDLKLLFDNIGHGDVRIQAVLIAFCFGGLLESLAGFGAPIAITLTMILIFKIPPLKAAMACLIANTAPVAYGAVAVPITTAGNMAPGVLGAELTAQHVAAIVGHIAPLFAVVVPLLVVIILDGKQGAKDCWAPALVTGISFGITQWWCSNFFAYEMTDIIASLVSFGVSVAFLNVYKLKGVNESRARYGLEPRPHGYKSTLPPVRAWMALLPYVVIIVVFALGKLVLPLTQFDIKFPWPGLNEIAADGTVTSLVLNYAGGNPGTTYNFSWLSCPGTMIIVAGLIVTLIYMIFNDKGRFKINFQVSIAELFKTVYAMRYTVLTIASVLSLAYVMNFSGQTIAIGQFLASTGPLFPLLSPILGWVGTAVTGSDTSANALFSSLQAEAANANAALAGTSANLFLAANTMGGVVGKMISPQSLAIAAAATTIYDKDINESAIFKKILPWSMVMLALLCLLIFAYSTVLGFVVPPEPIVM